MSVLGVVLAVSGLLSSCGSSSDSLCNGVKSVAGFVSQFSEGLDNFAENQYTQLRLDSLDALQTARAAVKDDKYGRDAGIVATRLQNFINSMDEVSWDVSQALESRDAVEAAATLGTPETLAAANSVESVVIGRCGLPSTVPSLVGSDTLPFPSVPAPTATDPPTNGPNEDSEFRATGQMVAARFGLTLTETEVVCLGRELQNVYDSGADNVDDVNGASIYQAAFDVCGINFSVPED